MRRIRCAAALAAVLAAVIPAGPASACVGRTINIGYFDAPDQVLVANILSVFIDERTGTTVRLAKFKSREEAFDALRGDRVSLYADHSGVMLARFVGETPAAGEERNVARLKEALNRKYNVVWVESVGYDRDFTGKERAHGSRGGAGLMLCKDTIAKFPALPKLLGKLRGVLDNETMASLLRESKDADPKTVARRFLKARKLI